VRLFVALRLPEPVRAALGAEIERLRRLAPAIAWVPPENLHVTLKFLGDVAPDRLAAVHAALADATAEATRFDLVIEGLGAFPAPARPRVLWAGIGEGHEALAALAGRVEAALGAAGFAPEARPYTGHVTLGRARAPRADPALAAALAAARARRFGRVRVERVSLMQSHLHPRGARYTELAAWGLGGSRENVDDPG